MADVRVMINGRIKFINEKLTKNHSFMKENGVTLMHEPIPVEPIKIPEQKEETPTAAKPKRKTTPRKRNTQKPQ